MGSHKNVSGVTVYRVGVPRLFASTDIQEFREQMQTLVDSQPGANFAIDFSPVEFVSSRGLGVLVALHKAVTSGKGNLVLFGVNPAIRQVLITTHLDNVLTLSEDENAALRALGVTL